MKKRVSIRKLADPCDIIFEIFILPVCYDKIYKFDGEMKMRFGIMNFMQYIQRYPGPNEWLRLDGLDGQEGILVGKFSDP